MGNLSTPKSVQKLQMALHAKAKAEAGYRFYALYDKVSREDLLTHAYAQCRSTTGPPGWVGPAFEVHAPQGVRLALGRGRIGMIISEVLVGLRGLGYLIIVYQNTFRIDKMFVPVIVVAIIGILLMGTVQIIEARVAPWTRRET
mgnify:CR=1 FL=1